MLNNSDSFSIRCRELNPLGMKGMAVKNYWYSNGLMYILPKIHCSFTQDSLSYLQLQVAMLLGRKSVPSWGDKLAC